MTRLRLDLDRASSASAKLLAAFSSNPRSPTSSSSSSSSTSYSYSFSHSAKGHSSSTAHHSASSPSTSRPYSSSSSRRKSESDSHHHPHPRFATPSAAAPSTSRHNHTDRYNGHPHSGHMHRVSSPFDEPGCNLPPKSPTGAKSSSSSSWTHRLSPAHNDRPGWHGSEPPRFGSAAEVSTAMVAGSSPGSDSIMGHGGLAARMLTATTEELFEIPEIGVPPEFAEMWVASHSDDSFSVASQPVPSAGSNGSLVCQCDSCRVLSWEEGASGEVYNPMKGFGCAINETVAAPAAAGAAEDSAAPRGVPAGLAAFLLDAPVEALFDSYDDAPAPAAMAAAAGGDRTAFPPGEGSCSGWLPVPHAAEPAALLAAEIAAGGVAAAGEAAMAGGYGDASLQQPRWFGNEADAQRDGAHRSYTMRASPALSSPAYSDPPPPQRSVSANHGSPWRNMGSREWDALASPASVAEAEWRARGRGSAEAEQAAWNSGPKSVIRGNAAQSGSADEGEALAHVSSAGSTLDAPFYADGGEGSSSHGSGRSGSSMSESASGGESEKEIFPGEPSYPRLQKVEVSAASVAAAAASPSAPSAPSSQHVTSPAELQLRAELMRMEADLAWAQGSAAPSAMPPALRQQLALMRGEVEALRQALDRHALAEPGAHGAQGGQGAQGERSAKGVVQEAQEEQETEREGHGRQSAEEEEEGEAEGEEA
ncbi:unnamed protein product [Closterium sp. Naga37s-1]|nr:unnamed protein product [Closterium sp. Naga37s-1]